MIDYLLERASSGGFHPRSFFYTLVGSSRGIEDREDGGRGGQFLEERVLEKGQPLRLGGASLLV